MKQTNTLYVISVSLLIIGCAKGGGSDVSTVPAASTITEPSTPSLVTPPTDIPTSNSAAPATSVPVVAVPVDNSTTSPEDNTTPVEVVLNVSSTPTTGSSSTAGNANDNSNKDPDNIDGNDDLSITGSCVGKKSVGVYYFHHAHPEKAKQIKFSCKKDKFEIHVKYNKLMFAFIRFQTVFYND